MFWALISLQFSAEVYSYIGGISKKDQEFIGINFFYQYGFWKSLNEKFAQKYWNLEWWENNLNFPNCFENTLKMDFSHFSDLKLGSLYL